MKRFVLIITALLFNYQMIPGKNISIIFNPDIPNILFAVNKLEQLLSLRGYSVCESDINSISEQKIGDAVIILSHPDQLDNIMIYEADFKFSGNFEAQDYSIRLSKSEEHTKYYIIGGSPRGAMYGILDIADRISGGGDLTSVKPADKKPFIKKRGIKFNIPLDARTPSYSDNNPISQSNIENMWDFNFWKEFLDQMALSRLNLLTLWTTSPFPSLVRIPEYPNIGLDDVKKTTIPITEFGTKSNASNMVTQEVLDNLITVKSISLDEKIKFWQNVMQYASDRGVDIIIYTWNVFTFGTENTGYDLTDDINDHKTRDYIRKATKSLIKTYPLLKGIGITAGENLSHDHKEDENFLFESYGKGINDALNEDPNKSFTLIHRLGDAAVARNAFADLHPRCSLSFCYKYSKAHVYSSVDPYWIHDHKFLEKIGESTTYYITARDDSYYYLRGGCDPDFIRAYVRNIPNTDSNFEGFQLGPDAIVWGREYVSKYPDTPNQLILNKRWFSFRLWGKIAYDPEVSDTIFIGMIKSRFPEVNEKNLFKAWSISSRVVPLVNRFHNHKAYLDYQWNPEICDSRAGYNSDNGFHDVNTFIRIKTQPGEGFVGIPEFVNGERNGTTPFQVAEELKKISSDTFELLNKIDNVNFQDNELAQTISDIKALANLGGYYSHKISASTNKALYDETGRDDFRIAAIDDLIEASNYWWEYSHILAEMYRPIYYSRLRKVVNVLETQTLVDKEIADLGGEIPIRSK